jgi:hypothetical protein
MAYYFADSGPKSGPILYRHGHGAIGVPEARDVHTPIGMALEAGWGEGGVALWKLIVRGVEVPGRWIVVGREFRPAQEESRQPR